MNLRHSQQLRPREETNTVICQDWNLPELISGQVAHGRCINERHEPGVSTGRHHPRPKGGGELGIDLPPLGGKAWVRHIPRDTPYLGTYQPNRVQCFPHDIALHSYDIQR